MDPVNDILSKLQFKTTAFLIIRVNREQRNIVITYWGLLTILLAYCPNKQPLINIL